MYFCGTNHHVGSKLVPLSLSQEEGLWLYREWIGNGGRGEGVALPGLGLGIVGRIILEFAD